jgi:hypothetical protein
VFYPTVVAEIAVVRSDGERSIRHGDGFTLRIDDVAVGKYRQGPVKGAKK